MAWYSVAYLLNVLNSKVSKKDKYILRFMVLFLLIFISGTRYYMGGSDVYAYENIYNDAPSIWIVLKYFFTGVNEGVSTVYEVGFILICSVGKMFQLSYFGFTLFYALIFYLLIYYGLRTIIKEWSVFIAIFMYKIMFYNTFISIRQGLTIAIFCFSLQYIINKKMVKYFFCCFVAFFVHRGAMILFPLYFAQYIPMSKKIFIRLVVAFAPTWFLKDYVNLGGVILGVIMRIGFAQKSLGWAESFEPISFIHTLECYIVMIVIIIFYDAIKAQGKEALLALQLVIFTLPIFTLCSNWIILTRIKDYFVIFYGILLGYIVVSKYVSVRTRNAILGMVFMLCYIGMIRYIIVFDNGELLKFTSFVFERCSIFL